MTCLKDKILPAPINSGFKMDDYWIWCGSVIEDENKDGFHMFSSRWSKEYPMFEGYIFLSEIVHAWSPTMTGPYKYKKTILPTGNASDWNGRMAHNPTIVKYGDQYLLYYIASTYENPMVNYDVVVNDSKTRDEIYHNIRIGVLISNTIDGPWERVEKPILEARPGKWDDNIVTNPAPCIHPDGRIFLYYRSNTPGGLRIGLAVANSPDGPYERVQDDPVMGGIDIEDPFVWHNGNHFEMIAKDMTGGITGEHHSGAHFVSDDGINWSVSEQPQAYSRNITYSDGSEAQLGCLERPQLLFNDKNEPICMFGAAADGEGGFRNADNTWNIALPISTTK